MERLESRSCPGRTDGPLYFGAKRQRKPSFDVTVPVRSPLTPPSPTRWNGVSADAGDVLDGSEDQEAARCCGTDRKTHFREGRFIPSATGTPANPSRENLDVNIPTACFSMLADRGFVKLTLKVLVRGRGVVNCRAGWWGNRNESARLRQGFMQRFCGQDMFHLFWPASDRQK